MQIVSDTEDLGGGCEFAEAFLLLLARAVVGELVAEDGRGVGDEGLDGVLFEAESEIEVGPDFVAVFENGQAEDEVVQVFEVVVAFALVAEAEDDVVDFDVCENHVV